MKPGDIIIRKEDFPLNLGSGLESDVKLVQDFLEEEPPWSAAIVCNHRVPDEECIKIKCKLEELSGVKWRRDTVSNFVFHLVIPIETIEDPYTQLGVQRTLFR